VKKITNRIDGDDARLGLNHTELRLYGFPQRLFLVNCWVHYLERRELMAPSEIRIIPGFYPQMDLDLGDFRTIPYVRWNAHTAPSDFTHIHRGVGVDMDNAVSEISLKSSWIDLEGESSVVSHSDGILLSAALARFTFSRMSSAFFVQTKVFGFAL